jgi:hypothetical protein
MKETIELFETLDEWLSTSDGTVSPLPEGTNTLHTYYMSFKKECGIE